MKKKNGTMPDSNVPPDMKHEAPPEGGSPSGGEMPPFMAGDMPRGHIPGSNVHSAPEGGMPAGGQNGAPPMGGGMPPFMTGAMPPDHIPGSNVPPEMRGSAAPRGGPPPFAAGGPPPFAMGGPPPFAMGEPPQGGRGKRFKSNYVKGEIPPEMRAIAPDYAKWRKKLLRMNFNICIAVLLFELAIFLVLNNNGVIDGFSWYYAFRYLGLPTLLNLLAVGVEAFLLKKFPKKDSLQDKMVLITQTVICTVVAATHYTTMQPMAMFCLPVLTSVVFGSSRLCLITTAISLCGLSISVTCRCLLTDGSDQYIIPETIVAATLIVLALLVAEIVNGLMNEQKNKLLRFIMEARRSQYEALVANNAKSDFLANMSHEIRTPINAILGMNEMILREEHNNAIREYATNIQTSGNLLLSIINDVLDISKIESGKAEIINVAYDISSLINDCYNMAAVRARGKELKINVQCGEDLPQLMSGDEAHIRQVVVNLLTNAVKYTEKGEVTLKVSGEYTEENKCTLTVSVKDTGIGISEENLKKLFTQFGRFDMERNRNIEGTGLGLTIVKHLVDLMDGRIDVKSKLNEGSEFTVTLTQEVLDKTPIGSVQLNYSHNSGYEYVRSFEAPDAHILAVDDLPMNLMVITNMLKDTKIRIDTANSGAEAIERCEQNKYDLILMDHMMPEMDGVETYAKLRADESSLCHDTPVIMLTANAIAGVRERYIDEGFTDYISKPVRGDKLESTIMKYLPSELIVTDISEEAADSAPEETDETAELTAALPQLNLKIALPYCCESMELFMDILRDYASSTRLEDMKEQFEKEDFENYRINAHSLKSTSLTVGLEGLSERARASEFALKSGGIDFVRMNHPELMEMYADALEKIRGFLKKHDENS